jgi:AraC-like DNA-binding protein/Txe/YoeB family toxin of Txe-Axe toxin-antitoxin module
MITISYSGGDVDTPHNRKEFMITYVGEDWLILQLQSDYLYDAGNGYTRGKSGDIFIIPPERTLKHGPSPEMNVGMTDDWMFINSSSIGELVDMLKLPTCEPFEVSNGYERSNGKFIDPYIRRINHERKRSYQGYEVMISSIITEMLVEMGRQYSKKVSMKNPQKQVIDVVRKEMLANYSFPYTLEILAKKSGYSAVHFSALYKKYHGISPIEDLILYRIMMAKEELLKKELSITAVAEKCGFSSVHYFSRIFKKYVGVSPIKFGRKINEL